MFRGLALKRFQKSIAQKVPFRPVRLPLAPLCLNALDDVVQNTLTHEVWEKMVKKSGRDAPAFVFEGRLKDHRFCLLLIRTPLTALCGCGC